VRPETGRGGNNWSVFEQCFRRGPVFLKNRPHDIKNPAALNLDGGFRVIAPLAFTVFDTVFRETPRISAKSFMVIDNGSR
jgi:hypothetical protein